MKSRDEAKFLFLMAKDNALEVDKVKQLGLVKYHGAISYPFEIAFEAILRFSSASENPFPLPHHYSIVLAVHYIFKYYTVINRQLKGYFDLILDHFGTMMLKVLR